MRRRKTDRRTPRPIAHSIIIRYDFDRERWVHSAGIVITPREAVLLEALANGHGPSSMAHGAGASVGTFYAAQARLKQYLGIPIKSAKGDLQLRKIAMDLYGAHR
jgi:DNA-binding CsgD family transcriptional regulator